MIFQIIVAIVMMIVSYLLMPKPKVESNTAGDMENPTASAGSPIKVVFGTVTIKDPNILWFGEKETNTFSSK